MIGHHISYKETRCLFDHCETLTWRVGYQTSKLFQHKITIVMHLPCNNIHAYVILVHVKKAIHIERNYS